MEGGNAGFAWSVNLRRPRSSIGAVFAPELAFGNRRLMATMVQFLGASPGIWERDTREL
jgi:hypothetical protein